MRSLDSNVASIEREGLAALDAVPLEGFQEELRHGCITVVGIEYVDVLRAEPGTLVHSAGGAIGPVLDLIQVRLRGALPEIVLGVVQHVDRRLPHVASAIGGREQVSGRGVDRPVAIPQP